MNKEKVKRHIPTILWLVCGISLIGYAAVCWPSWQSYFILTLTIVCFVIVLCLWIHHVRYLRRMEDERKLVKMQKEGKV